MDTYILVESEEIPISIFTATSVLLRIFDA